MTPVYRVDDAIVAYARKLLVDMHVRRQVGHLGGNLSVIDALALIFLELKTPDDTVILSKGHSAGALYVCLAMAGLIGEEELSTFHQDGTRLPGHPPANLLPSVPFATGSLGHGLSLAAGVSFAHKLKCRPGQVYCVMSDGEWQEGSTWEALWFANRHRLSNLTMLIDQNGLQGFGSTSEIADMGDLAHRVAAHGVACISVDGHSLDELRTALDAACDDRPKAVFARTVKGRGIAWFEGEMRSHYVPVPQDLVDALGLSSGEGPHA